MNFIQKLRRLNQKSKGWGKAFDSQYPQVSVIKKLYAKNGLHIELTCGACPEQYDVFKGDEQVAYYRLRHGEFRVDFPDCGGETIYYSEPNGDGIFDSSERFNELAKSMRALLNHIDKLNPQP